MGSGKWTRCEMKSSTVQNLAKHCYNVHFKDDDVDSAFTVIAEFGFVSRSLAKDLVNSKKRRRGTTKRTNKPTGRTSKRRGKSVKSQRVKKSLKRSREVMESTRTDA